MAVQITDDYIDLLNKGVAREIQVSLQYLLQHAKMEKILRKVRPENYLLDKTTYETIAKDLKDFGIQEMKHAAKIIERIYFLGGMATTKATKITIGETLKEFADLDYKAEEEALILYREVIEAARAIGDMETYDDFIKIYSDEEKHLFRFQELLSMDDSEPAENEPESKRFREVFTEDYIAMLNKAVAGEIGAIIQYTNQHEKANWISLRKLESPLEVISDRNKAKVVSDMLKHVFMTEMQHLETISERIYKVKAECVSIPDPLPVIGENADDFLLNDHKAEDDAIMLYREIVEEALKRGDTVTRRIFEKIIDDEESHYWAFDDFF
jgi:bacterioferritin